MNCGQANAAAFVWSVRSPAYETGCKHRPSLNRKRHDDEWKIGQMDKKDLEEKLKALEEKIAEVNRRMPAHSVKPPIMIQLFALEDERDEVLNQLELLIQRKDR